MEIKKERRVSPRWLPQGNDFKLKQRTFLSKDESKKMLYVLQDPSIS